MTIGRILGKLEADLQAMTAERDAAWCSNAALADRLVVADEALAAMTAERDAALKQLALTEDQALGALAAMTAERDAALSDAREWRAGWYAALSDAREWREIAERLQAQAAQVLQALGNVEAARLRAEKAADDFGYFW